MKKTIYLGLSLFAMGTFFTGCKKEMNHSSSKVIPGETIAGNLKNETFDEYVYWKDSLIINENQIDLYELDERRQQLDTFLPIIKLR